MENALLFGTSKPVIGMLHVPALPGSPRNRLRFNEIIDWVLMDADALASGGIDGWILENFGDAPFYPRRVPAHTVAFMTAIGREILHAFQLPLGINVLRNDAESAIAIASAVSAEFIRVNIHTGARLTDQGLIEGVAHETLRYRRTLGSHVKILADVAVKHSAAIARRPLTDEIEEALSRGGADAIIVTGSATGKATPLEDLKIAKQAAGQAQVFAGSGVDETNLAETLQIADGLIVGTAFKRDGVTTNEVDADLVSRLINAVKTLRAT